MVQPKKIKTVLLFSCASPSKIPMETRKIFYISETFCVSLFLHYRAKEAFH